MDRDKAIGKRKIIPTAIRMAAYLPAVTLIFSVISILCSVDTKCDTNTHTIVIQWLTKKNRIAYNKDRDIEKGVDHHEDPK